MDRIQNGENPGDTCITFLVNITVKSTTEMTDHHQECF